MGKSLSVLLLADSEDDATLIAKELTGAAFKPTVERATTKEAFRDALANGRWDAVVADLEQPDFDGGQALRAYRRAKLDCPFILISSMAEADESVKLMAAGAHDLIRRDDLSRLAPALIRELRAATNRNELAAANHALNESEQRFRAVVDNLPASLCLKDRDGRFLLVNREFTRRYDLCKQDVLGKTVHDFRPRAYADSVAAMDRRLLETEHPITYEREVRERDGVRHTYLVSRYPIFDAAGNLTSLGLISTDISEQKNVEEALRESEERFRRIFEEGSDAMFIVDAETGLYEDVNTAALALYGYSRDEFLQMTPLDLSAHRKATKASLEEIRSRGSLRIEARNSVTKCGTVVPVSIGAWTVTMGGAEKIVFAVRDISARVRVENELRQSEARLQAFLEASPESVTMKDLEGRYVLVNRAFSARTGLPPDELVGRKTSDIWPASFTKAAEKVDRQVKKTGKSVSYQFELAERDGHEHTYAGSKFPVFDADGQLAGIGSVLTDITERQEMERRLAQAQKMEAVGHLTGGVAHDFNNLLAIIIGNAEMLGNYVGGDKKASACVERILMAVDRGSSLTTRLLAFSRRQALKPKPTDVSELIGSLDDMLRRTLGETIDLRAEHDPDLWPAIIDPHQLEHAVINLALNARDAMPDGGTLTIATANVALDRAYAAEHDEVTPGDFVEVAIGDTGTGMPPEILGNVFEPFFTTKEIGKGSGLGLSMVYGFVKQSNGHVVIDSAVDQGTTVKLFLPRSDMAPDTG